MPDAEYHKIIEQLLPREKESLILSTTEVDFDDLRDSEVFGSYATIKHLDELGLIEMIDGPKGRELRMSDTGFEVAKLLTCQMLEDAKKVQALKAEIMDFTGQLSRAGLKETYAAFLPKRWSQVTVIEELQSWRDRLQAILHSMA